MANLEVEKSESNKETIAIKILALFVGLVFGFSVGGGVAEKKYNNHLEEIRRDFDLLVDDYDSLIGEYKAKLASKEVQVTFTQASYAECDKRYTEPRPIVCK